ncbi:hypothetical protein [Prauserella cavernicola]|uniref:Alpha/beta hydrolase n=1 Tax=Prauserella cavernicola TaxID=2800127 RepID=A0A934QYD8_9PSEU|nr:hypothetical protein [Prauserella cavernicola]MBK1788417.1 hypothetical protein [Prauserella cavernicola]
MSEPRTHGPALVREGQSGAPAILVLDPLGEAKHGDLPPTWSGLVADRHVCWCRLPADGARTEAEDLLADPDAIGYTVDLVVSGPVAFEGLGMAARHPDTVRSVLLVAPESHSLHDGEDLIAARTTELESEGVVVTVVARSFEGERDRIGPPLPLGHPDVAVAIHHALTARDRA